jgi:hypothetical protein
LRCGRCGNENNEANRFCGMCGAPLVGKTAGAGQTSPQTTAASPSLTAPGPAATPAASVPRQEPVPAPREATHAPSDARPSAGPVSTGPASTGPIITGPSFLGLSAPGPYVERHAERHGERDSLRPSSNLDYLLEDEEEPQRGWGKLIMIVVALALVVGLSYLHWRQGGFEWARGGDNKPAAAKQAADAAPSSADSGSASGTATMPEGTTPAAGAGGGGTAGATDSGASQAGPAQSNASPVTSPVTPPAASAQTQPSDASVPATSAAPPAGPDAGGSAGAAGADVPNVEKRKPGATKPIAKPAPAKPAAAKPYDVVAEAERYLYGRGVAQNCDHGMRLLKTAAEQSNSKAMISMGALYSTGTCTPRDLPTAYRWFALALHKEPDNQALQNDLQQLWSKMTQPERQLAIKLSQ